MRGSTHLADTVGVMEAVIERHHDRQLAIIALMVWSGAQATTFFADLNAGWLDRRSLHSAAAPASGGQPRASKTASGSR